LKFLIAGLGSIGRRHLQNLVALGQDDIVLYRTHQSTLPDEALAPYPMETDLEAALAHKPDGVIVSNPTALHLDIAIPAARAGCHILLEKPVAAHMDERVETLQRVATQANIQVLVGFQFRFHPVLNRIKVKLEGGDLGRVYSFRSHWGEYLPGWHPWEDYRQGYAARKDLGGGVVNTLCHPLDYVRWLFGEVAHVSAITSQVSDLELDVEDAAEISLVMEENILGSVHLDYFQRPPAHWLTINCEKGSIHWDNAIGVAKVFHVDEGQWEIIEPPAGFERNDLFLEEMRHFLAMIMGETESRCRLEDGIEILKLTQIIHNQSKSILI